MSAHRYLDLRSIFVSLLILFSCFLVLEGRKHSSLNRNHSGTHVKNDLSPRHGTKTKASPKPPKSTSWPKFSSSSRNSYQRTAGDMEAKKPVADLNKSREKLLQMMTTIGGNGTGSFRSKFTTVPITTTMKPNEPKSRIPDLKKYFKLKAVTAVLKNMYGQIMDIFKSGHKKNGREKTSTNESSTRRRRSIETFEDNSGYEDHMDRVIRGASKITQNEKLQEMMDKIDAKHKNKMKRVRSNLRSNDDKIARKKQINNVARVTEDINGFHRNEPKKNNHIKKNKKGNKVTMLRDKDHEDADRYDAHKPVTGNVNSKSEKVKPVKLRPPKRRKTVRKNQISNSKAKNDKNITDNVNRYGKKKIQHKKNERANARYGKKKKQNRPVDEVDDDDKVEMWSPGNDPIPSNSDRDDIIVSSGTEEIKLDKKGKLKAKLKNPKNADERSATVETKDAEAKVSGDKTQKNDKNEEEEKEEEEKRTKVWKNRNIVDKNIAQGKEEKHSHKVGNEESSINGHEKKYTENIDKGMREKEVVNKEDNEYRGKFGNYEKTSNNLENSKSIESAEKAVEDLDKST